MNRSVLLAALTLAAVLATTTPAHARYVDGANLYEYVRSQAITRRDHGGTLSSDNKSVKCMGYNLRVKTHYCCAPDVKRIETDVCSAFKTLWAARQATKPLKREGANLNIHHEAHGRFINFFNAGKEYASDAKRAKAVRAFRNDIIKELIDELDDDDGMLYRCHPKEEANSADRWWGYTIWIGSDYLNSPPTDGKMRTKSLIHELSHLYVQAHDDGGWYITTVGEDGLPGYTRGTYVGDTYEGEDSTDPDITRTTHADTITWFMIQWYTP